MARRMTGGGYRGATRATRKDYLRNPFTATLKDRKAATKKQGKPPHKRRKRQSTTEYWK